VQRQDNLIDLDFTKPPVPAKTASPEAPLRADAEVGALGPGHAGNTVFFLAARPRRVVAVADAPIALVEDDEVTRRVLERALALQGHPVRASAHGRDFLQSLRKAPLPRLVLLDVELPEVTGFKLLTLLRQHPQTAGIPVVLLTARSESKDLMHGLSLGADGYLSKPVKIETLRALLGRLLA
jgi:CheY-like chemotaxis protein